MNVRSPRHNASESNFTTFVQGPVLIRPAHVGRKQNPFSVAYLSGWHTMQRTDNPMGHTRIYQMDLCVASFPVPVPMPMPSPTKLFLAHQDTPILNSLWT